ncbi:hypothetical protein MKW98_004073 [Papaver atlanticum]|uniref:Uncharacterized protein n=1 Tax=Papaver atlanticum TaxID=357466 RepID=A0AAD4XP83_9MAGN|nr:hypothetical protein MKW98_004073 [Papaver atlanticum]
MKNQKEKEKSFVGNNETEILEVLCRSERIYETKSIIIIAITVNRSDNFGFVCNDYQFLALWHCRLFVVHNSRADSKSYLEYVWLEMMYCGEGILGWKSGPAEALSIALCINDKHYLQQNSRTEDCRMLLFYYGYIQENPRWLNMSTVLFLQSFQIKTRIMYAKSLRPYRLHGISTIMNGLKCLHTPCTGYFLVHGKKPKKQVNYGVLTFISLTKRVLRCMLG